MHVADLWGKDQYTVKFYLVLNFNPRLIDEDGVLTMQEQKKASLVKTQYIFMLQIGMGL
jgi:hypothetical protein